jgi:hypothetical protein
MPKNMFSKSFQSRRFLLTVFSFFILNSEFLIAQGACTCDEGKLAFSKSYIGAHDLIFRGKSVSIERGSDYGMAKFSVMQLFKGTCPKEITVYFDQKAECSLKIKAGDDWIIYANFKQIQKPFVEYCSRSRKNVINTNKNVDLQYIKSDLTIDAECEQLQEQVGLQKLSAQAEEDNRHSNIIPDFSERIILIVCSIVGFVVIYLVLNRLLKK